MGRFNSLHSFDLSGLKWGNQKILRCVKAKDHSNAYVNFDLSDLKWGRQKILICIKKVDEIVNIDMDEDLNDIIDKISKIVFDDTLDIDMDEDLNDLRVVIKMRKCSLAFSSSATKQDSKGYKSEIKKIIEGYSSMRIA